MKTIKEHIPPSLFSNMNVERFSNVLDGMLEYKRESILLLENAFNIYTNKDPVWVKKFMYELGQIQAFTDMPLAQQEAYILQARHIFGKKGSLNGLQLFVETVCSGTVTADFSNWWPPAMLILNDYEFGYLPDSEDLALSVNSPNDYPYLFANSFSVYYSFVSININSDLLENRAQFRREMALFLPNILPMCDPGSSNIVINFYKDDAVTLLETINL